MTFRKLLHIIWTPGLENWVHPESAVSLHAEKTLWFSAGLASKIWSGLFSVKSFSLPTSPIHTNKQLIIIERARVCVCVCVCVCVQCMRQSMPNLSNAAFVQSSGKKTKEVISIFSLNNANSLMRRRQIVYETLSLTNTTKSLPVWE